MGIRNMSKTITSTVFILFMLSALNCNTLRGNKTNNNFDKHADGIISELAEFNQNAHARFSNSTQMSADEEQKIFTNLKHAAVKIGKSIRSLHKEVHANKDHAQKKFNIHVIAKFGQIKKLKDEIKKIGDKVFKEISEKREKEKADKEGKEGKDEK